MNEQQQTPSQKRLELLRGIAALGVIPIYAIIHCMCGLRFLKPTILLGSAAAFFTFAASFPAMLHPLPILLPLYAIAAVICGLCQRKFRWQELLSGKKTWHSYSAGIPWISLFKWPAWFTKESRLVRIVEPAIVFITGIITSMFLSKAFGIYLMIASGLMCVFQQMVYEASINHLLDTLDGLIIAEAQSLQVAHFKNPSTPPPTVHELGGTVASGVSNDLLKAIERKRARKAAAGI